MYCCLGYSAEERSHLTPYLNVQQAIQLMTRGAKEKPVNDNVEPEESDNEDYEEVAFEVFLNDDGSPELCSKATDYYYRGPELAFLNLYIYAAIIVRVRAARVKTKRTRGRHKNACFSFMKNHPLATSFVQQIRSKFVLPSPGYMPHWSQHSDSIENSTSGFLRRAKYHAKYFSALFCPFSEDVEIGYDIESWKTYLKTFKKYSQPDEALAGLPSEIYATLLKIINNMRIGVQDSAFEEPRNLINRFRYNKATEFSEWCNKIDKTTVGNVMYSSNCSEREALEGIKEAEEMLSIQQSEIKRSGKRKNEHETELFLAGLEKQVSKLIKDKCELHSQKSCKTDGNIIQRSQLSKSILKSHIIFVTKGKSGRLAVNAPVAHTKNDVFDAKQGEVDLNQSPFSATESPTPLHCAGFKDALNNAKRILQSRPKEKALDSKQGQFVLQTMQQTEIHRDLDDGYLVFLHGGPGTGKSETCRCLMEAKLLHRPGSILAFGYSGYCAVNVLGETIHSGFAFPTAW